MVMVTQWFLGRRSILETPYLMVRENDCSQIRAQPVISAKQAPTSHTSQLRSPLAIPACHPLSLIRVPPLHVTMLCESFSVVVSQQ